MLQMYGFQYTKHVKFLSAEKGHKNKPLTEK